MLVSVFVNGALGFGMTIAVLFCIGDVSTVLNTATGYPFIQIFADATGSNGAASAMVSLSSNVNSEDAVLIKVP